MEVDEKDDHKTARLLSTLVKDLIQARTIFDNSIAACVAQPGIGWGLSRTPSTGDAPTPTIILKIKRHSETGEAAFEGSCRDAPNSC